MLTEMLKGPFVIYGRVPGEFVLEQVLLVPVFIETFVNIPVCTLLAFTKQPEMRLVFYRLPHSAFFYQYHTKVAGVLSENRF